MFDEHQDMPRMDEEEEKIRMFDDNQDFPVRLAEWVPPIQTRDSVVWDTWLIALALCSLKEVASLGGAAQGRGLNIHTAFLQAIASHLAPLTVLHLSRTSKVFRRMLMNKASRWVWRRALRTVPGLPACPEDLNESLYTALIFDSYCFACGVPDAFSVDYALRLRLCESCWKANVTEGIQVLQQVTPVVREFILMLVSSANIFNFKDIKRSLTRVNPATHVEQDSFYGPELRALTAFFWPNLPTVEDLTELKTAFLDRAEYVLTRQMHAVKLHAWERVLGADRLSRDIVRAAIADRDYIDFAFHLGWHMHSDWWSVPPDEAFDHIPGPGWEVLEQGFMLNKTPPKSRAQIAAEELARSQRETAAYQARLAARHAELTEWYFYILEANRIDAIDADEMPNAHDGARLFDAELATMNDARALITAGLIEASETDILARAHAYSFEVPFALSALLPPPRPRKGKRAKPWWERPCGAIASMIARPTALFVCDIGGCGECALAWPEINWHWRDEHAEESVWHSLPGGRQSRMIRAKVWDEGVVLAKRILDVAGLRGDTEADKLDEMCAEGRLYCACGDPELDGRDALTWAYLVRHVHRHLKMDECRTPDHVIPWINDHSDLKACIMLLPKGADTSPAFVRVKADPYTTARINALLAARPEGSSPICPFCVTQTDTRTATARDNGRFLTPRAGAIVYHMQANPAMLDEYQEMEPVEKKLVHIFEENIEFQHRLEDLLEIALDHASYDPNGIRAAFHRAISRRPLTVPPPPTDSEVRPVLGSGAGRQTKILEYFRWFRKFPDLPMEVIMEIASHMAPLTLLYFSRTSKLFRKTLMNKASRWAWQGALHTVLGLPPCPEDMNEALYTALVFDRYCFACGTPDAFFVDYALRLRLCESCWDANISVGFSLDWHMSPHWDQIPEEQGFDNAPGPSPDSGTIAQGVALNSDPPKSKAQITKEHRHRADRESVTYHKRLERRYHQLAKWYEGLVRSSHEVTDYELPNAYDGARLFATLAAANDARTSINEDTVGAYSAAVLARAQAYTLDVRCALVELLPPACGPRPLAEDREMFIWEMLDRPTALFLCDFPSCRGDSAYEWDQLTEHWRDFHRNESVWRTLQPQRLGVLQPASERRKIRARFWDEGAELVERILDAAGLARVTSMDEVLFLCSEGRLYCVCGDPELCPRDQQISWSEFVWHVHEHVEMDKCRRPRDGLQWINDHRDLSKCIKLFPEDDDISATCTRVTASPDAFTRIEAFCKTRPKGGSLVCSLCEAMIDDPKKADRRDIGTLLDSRRPWDYIVYHMQAK
ncbi:hypothetical protein GSI_03154 [Ganoderma sinense ZZ0214-1]|uniref:F-box domain-containing protein n=1 Tax=Ganoderma sinense ZZ0214-1 TaxID=1077348 RepID=A0A2G8SKT6_9APHY|nr:hypothetical protein GSI_03154 [Ganoderma sinense ZZ0214-1]